MNVIDNGIKKFQWSKFSPDKSEQIVLRTDDFDELTKYIDLAKSVLPTANAFPEDEGRTAHTPSQTVPASPICGVHKVPMNWKTGISKKTNKPYAFWSCAEKNPDDSWCNYKPI